MARRHKRRRGIVLLIILTLLTLLIVVGLTFALLSGQFRVGAESSARKDRYGMPPEKLLDRAMGQFLREPRDTRSVAWGHSMLRDLYGIDGFKASITGFTASSTGSQRELLELQVNKTSPSRNLSAWEGYYTGRVLTILNGPAYGISVRVVNSIPVDVNNCRLVVEMPAYDDASRIALNPIAAFVGRSVLVNGQVFNGTGVGFDPTTANLDRLATTALLGSSALLLENSLNPKPLALLPNYSAVLSELAATSGLGVLHELFGDVDEDYDAPDYQNMLLGMVPPGVTESRQIIPSLHRPALIHYWRNRFQYDSDASDLDLQARKRAELLRCISLRPLPLLNHHPGFTGGNINPALAQPVDPLVPAQLEALYQALEEGPWDVDNDGDGIPDSIWVDLGMPMQTSPDGRNYRPLFAVLCLDLDGRVNINASGTLAQLDPPSGQLFQFSSGGEPIVAGALSQVARSQGSGYGPAEINLLPILGISEYSRLLTSRYGEYFQGVPDLRPGMPGTLGNNGAFAIDDLLIRLKHIGLPEQLNVPDYYGGLGLQSAYLDWPDVFGRGALVLDRTGCPLTAYMGRNQNVAFDPDGGATPSLWNPVALPINERVDVPYQTNLVQEDGRDVPFAPADLEALLRRWDVDAASHSKRLLRVAPVASSNALSRSMLTTHSFDVPAPNTQAPRIRMTSTSSTDMRESLGDERLQVVDLLVARLNANSVPVAQLQAQVDLMLPFELRHGERLDINRAFGNGLDDNGDGVVDDPMELTLPEQVFADAGLATRARYENDYPNGATAADGRQILARHLFCLMMLLTDERYVHPLSPDEPPFPAGVDSRELTVRRIAQWAVNVVDFRDADAIMSPFEYDMNPFDGWSVDGDLTTVDGSQRRVVWGCESPELVMTESLAFHDRRVKDTDKDSTLQKIDPTGPDQTMDQYRIPQGSLFLEFYCPRSRKENNPVAPRELYSINTSTGEFALDLARMAPADGGVRKPVWQVAISRSHIDPSVSPEELRDTNPDSVSFQPDDMSLFPSTLPETLDIERYVWFAPVNPASVGIPPADAQTIYWNRSGAGNALLRPCSYAVVGPRPETHIGSQDVGAFIPPPAYLPSQQRILLTPGQVQYFTSDNTDRTPTLSLVKAAQTIVAAANPPTDPSFPVPWVNVGDTAPLGIGLNVTEPLPRADYYQEPTASLSDANGFPFDSYYDYDNSVGLLPGEPFDSDPSRPLADDGMLGTKTTQNYKTAFLQRLANPLLPWNPVLNPYITVDWIPIDVSVFNGEDPSGDPDPDDDDPQTPNFESRERAGANRNLWSFDTQPPTVSNLAPGSTDYFPYNMIHSLGYLNEPFGTAALNHPVGATLVLGSTAPTPEYVGDPADGPFPWLTWNNRPLVSAYELMLVPASSASRLCHEYSMTSASATNPYSTVAPATDFDTFHAPFGHLLNFYHSDLVASSSGSDSADFYRLFDFVDVPSRFVGTEKWYNPSQFQPTGDAPDDEWTQTFRPPFNRLSRFRDPGRVNINTAYGEDGTSDYIWQALTYNFPDPTTALYWQDWSKIAESRRGYSTAGFHDNYPTTFAGVFRSSVCGDLAPPTYDPDGVTAPTANDRLRQYGVQATLLRSSDPKDTTNPGDPLLKVDETDYSVAALPHRSQYRNPYFYYEGVERLRNLLTTHSNVYAVWITVGYFEVQPYGSPDAAHPDGFQLGRELGEDSGTVKRHRAFYLIDRSIPVAFEPGENHNVDRAILLRRFIE